MPINTLYHTWIRRIQELRPTQRITQIRNFVWLLVGIQQSRSVCLSRIAGKIPGAAKLPSLTRRLSRFLDNPAIQVRDWYEPIARQWIEAPGRFAPTDPLDRGWNQNRVHLPALDGQPGVSPPRHPDCLDLGAPRQGT